MTCDIDLALTRDDLLCSHHFIGGEWTTAESSASFAISNPATGETISQVADGGTVDAQRALQAACDAFPTWASLTARERSGFLKR